MVPQALGLKFEKKGDIRLGFHSAVDAEVAEFLAHADSMPSTSWRSFDFHRVA